MMQINPVNDNNHTTTNLCFLPCMRLGINLKKINFSSISENRNS